MARTLSHASLSFASILVASSLAGGCTLGIRARNGCPEGEVCSDLTPNGLVFSGEAVSGGTDSYVPVAAGGTRHVTISVNGGGMLPPHQALVRDAAIATSDAAAVDGDLGLTGLSPGRTLLRLVDPATGELFDAVALRVEAIDDVEVVPSVSALPEGLTGWAMLAGVDGALWITLRAADGSETIDDGMTVEGLTLVPQFWSQYRVEAEELVAGTVPLTIHAAGADFARDVVVVDAIDDVVFDVGAGTDLVVGDIASFCVLGVAGTRAVTGVTGTFTASGAVTSTSSLVPQCATVEATSSGTGTVTVTSGAHTASITVDVAPAMEGMASSGLTRADVVGPVSRSIRGLRR